MRIPTGSAITAPAATISSVPSSALAIPPSANPCGLWKTNPKLSDDAPWYATEYTTITSIATAITAAAVATTRTTRLTATRRRRLPDGVSGAVGSNSPDSPSVIGVAALITGGPASPR